MPQPTAWTDAMGMVRTALGQFEKLVDVAVRLTAVLGGVLLLLMMAHVTADVLARLILSRPLPGTTAIVSNWWMVIVCFLPLGLVERRGAMISVTLLSQRFGPVAAKLQGAAVALLGIAVFSALAMRSTEDALRSFEAERVVIEQSVVLPIWLPHFALPVGTGLAAVVLAVRLLRLFVTTETGRGA